MRILKILLISLAVVIVAIAGVLVYVSNQDLSKYAFVQETLEDFTGRDVAMNGETKFKVGITSTATVNDVTLANASWGSEPDMIKVGTLVGEFETFPLLWGEVRVNRFVLGDTDIFLETDASGRGNWVFAKGEAPEPTAERGGGSPFEVQVGGVQVENLNVTYRDGTTGETHRLGLDELTASAESAEHPLDLLLKARYQDQPVEIEGQVGPLRRFFSDQRLGLDLTAKALGVSATAKGELEATARDNGQALDVGVSAASTAELAKALKLDFPELNDLDATATISSREGAYSLQSLDAKVGVGDGEITAKGAVDDLQALTGIDLAIAVAAPSVRDFSGLAQAELPDAGPVKISAQLKSVDQGYSVPDFTAELGDSKITGEASVNMSTAPKQVRLKIAADTLNLDQFLPQPSPGAGASGAQASPGAQKPSPGKLFSSEPLPFEKLKGLDVEASIQAKRIILNNVEIADVSIPLSVKGGKLSTTPTATLADGTLNGELQVDAGSAPPSTAIKVDLNRFLLGKLMAMVTRSDLVSGGLGDFSLNLTSRGDSVSALMAQSNGNLRLIAGKGEIANKLLDTAGTGIFLGMLSFLVPNSEKDKVTQMECSRVINDIKDGIVSVQRLALVSSQSVLEGGGTINLRDETYDMGVGVKARQGVSLSAGDLAGNVLITGPLSAPAINIGAEGVARTALSGTAAVMTGGLTFLAEKVLETSTSKDPCAAVQGGAAAPTTTQKTSSAEPPSDQGEPAQAGQAEEQPTNPIESLGKSIKGIFEGN